MTSKHTTLYRDKQNGKLLGVCAGIADYTGINVMWVRIAALLLIPMIGPIVLGAYFVSGLMLNKKPPHLYVDAELEEMKRALGMSDTKDTQED